VAYYLLTGREAFHRENPMKTLMAVVNEDPAPLNAGGAGVPDELAGVVKRCLAKAPGDRFPRAADLEAALAGCAGCGKWTEAKAADWWAAHSEGLKEDGTDLNSLPLRDSAG
jgi:serine/threonine-protein kinase